MLPDVLVRYGAPDREVVQGPGEPGQLRPAAVGTALLGVSLAQLFLYDLAYLSSLPRPSPSSSA